MFGANIFLLVVSVIELLLGANVDFLPSVRIFLSFLSSLFRAPPRQICEKFLRPVTPCSSFAAQIIFAFTPNSAAAERVFSMLKSMFGDQQMETLADIIQTALMLRINERRVG